MVKRLSVLIVTTLVAGACGSAPPEPQAGAASTPTAVRVTTVAREVRPDVLEAGGVLHGHRTAVVASRVMATVTRVLVEPGDHVRAGHVLVELEDAAVAAAAQAAAAGREAADRGLERARAEASVAAAAATLARNTYARIRTLYERRSATAQELDDATAAQAAAEARLAAAEAAVAEATAVVARAAAGGAGARAVAGWSRVTAPFSGVVTEKMIEPGALAVPGTPLVRVEDTTVLELDVRVDDSRAAFAHTGETLTVLIDADGDAVRRDGRITEMGRAADVDSRAVAVTITLADSTGLRPGMFGRAHLPGPSRTTLAVPESAIVRRGQLTSVFVIDGDTARMRLVRLGTAFGADIEVVAGLTEGDCIVIAPPAALRDGATVAASVARRQPTNVHGGDRP